MSAYEAKCTRIAEALQTLVAEEALAIRLRDFSTVEELQARVSPLIEFLTAHPREAARAHAVIEAVREQRRASDDFLTQEMAGLRDELCALELKRRNLARIAPAYAGVRSTLPQLSVVG